MPRPLQFWLTFAACLSACTASRIFYHKPSSVLRLVWQAKTGFKTTSADALTGRSGRAAASARVALTAGNLARHLERLSAGSAARAAAASAADPFDPRPKGFADLPASVEALILHDAFEAGGRTLRSWLNLSLVSRCLFPGHQPLPASCPSFFAFRQL